MAAIVQHSIQEESAARAFWQSQLGEHPTLAGLLAVALEVTGFFLNGHFLVWLGQKVMSVAGRIAETALLFAVLWISGTSVAPGLVVLVMSAETMHALVSVALVALALIPEIILSNAIVNALGHIQTATEQRTPVSWAWAVLFTLPTVMFFGLTAYTLNVLIQSGGNFVAASTGLVGLRCFAGWTYGLLELVYAGVRRRSSNGPQINVTPIQPGPAMPSIDSSEIARQLLPMVVAPIQEMRSEMTGQIERLSEQVVSLQSVHFAQESEPEGEPSGNQEETTEETDIVHLEDYRSEQSGNTDSLPTVNEKAITRELKPLTKKAPDSGRKNARTTAVRVLKKFPDIGPSELAQRAQISKSYASKIIAEREG